MAIEPHSGGMSKALAQLLENLDNIENIDHEKLRNLLGGDSNGHYHLTSTERTNLLKLLTILLPNDNTDYPEIDHEKLKNLLGGDNNGHYHLTSAERQKLGELITNGTPTVETNHERLEGLLGGDSSGHYHLTSDERLNLLRLIRFAFEEGSSSVHISHEKLTDLLGGNSGGHYHLTEAQRTKLINLPSSFTSVEVVNALNSTSTTAALSAYQGNVLNAKISNKLESTAISGEDWTFTLEGGSTVIKKVALL